MARALIQAEVSGGGTVSVAVDDVTGVDLQRVSRESGAVIAKLDEPLDQAIASTRPATAPIIDTFRALSPDGLTVEFGLVIDGRLAW